LVRAVRAVRAIAFPSVLVSLARIEHGQLKQKLTKSQWLQKKEKCSKKKGRCNDPPFLSLKLLVIRDGIYLLRHVGFAKLKILC
jgi:hypothetical protein